MVQSHMHTCPHNLSVVEGHLSLKLDPLNFSFDTVATLLVSAHFCTIILVKLYVFGFLKFYQMSYSLTLRSEAACDTNNFCYCCLETKLYTL